MMTTSEPSKLRESLTFWQITATGVGIVIGAGIYVLVGEAAKDAGNGVWISFGVAALLSALTAMTYAELTSMFPSAGAEYEYGRQAFNEFFGFIAGWMMIVAYVVAAAAVSIGFAHYLQHFVGVDLRLGAIGLLLVLTMVVISGIQRSIWLSVGLAVLQVGGLLLVIASGAPHIGDRSVVQGASATGVLSGAALVFFAFIGFDDIATLSEETRDAEKVIPRALLATLLISAVLYMLVGLSAVSLVGGDALAASDRPLAVVIEHDWGSSASGIIAVLALAATMNTTLVLLTASSRIMFGMSRHGAMPQALARVGRRGQAPYVGAIVSCVVAAMFATIGKIGLVASVTDFSVYTIFLMMNASVIALRFRMPEAQRSMRTPLNVGRVPLLPIAAISTILLMLAFIEPQAWILGAAALIAGCFAWLTIRPRDTGGPETSLPLRRVKLPRVR
jgi:basic amino acid/polyamine antiporter, APA family